MRFFRCLCYPPYSLWLQNHPMVAWRGRIPSHSLLLASCTSQACGLLRMHLSLGVFIFVKEQICESHYPVTAKSEPFSFSKYSVLLAQMALLSLAFSIFPSLTIKPKVFVVNGASRHWRHVRTTIFFTIITTLLVTIYRWPPPPTLLKSGRRIVNAGIWTVHFGFDDAGRDSQRRMRDLIRYDELGATTDLVLIPPPGIWIWIYSDCWRPIYTYSDFLTSEEQRTNGLKRVVFGHRDM